MDILFVVMPFADVECPSLGVSLLAAAARRRGYTCAVRYFGLDLAARIGLPLYTWIAQRGDQEGLDVRAAESLVGERFFGDVAFPGQLPDVDAWLARFLPGSPLAPALREAMGEASSFVDACAAEITRLSPKIVAFTTTFHQTVGSLAVARRLPEPRPKVLFGGANCEGDMGIALLEAFPEIDAVCTGEGDEVIVPYLDRVLRGEGPPVPGVVERGQAPSRPSPVHELDRLPIPDFSDFFEQVESARASAAPDITPRLVVETSRGCWWGAKHHCTFCGLNAGGMVYRSKSPERVVDEMTGLSSRWGIQRIECVDNILDPRHIDRVFPDLVRRGAGLRLFYETKSNLRYDELVTLREGGVRAIQPGIESLSTKVLDLMKKGVTAATNLRLLVWCSELGIDVAWNILFGFPGEPPDEYAKMAELAPLLVHLPPPRYVGPVRLDRFSPLFDEAVDARPKPAYAWAFPVSPSVLARIAYFFDPPVEPDTSYAGDLVRAVRAWNDVSRQDPPRLDLFCTESVGIIRDSRPVAVRSTHVLHGAALRVYLACERGGRADVLARALEMPVDAVHDELQRLRDLRLVVELDGRWVGLAVCRRRPPRAAISEQAPRRAPLPVLR